MEISLKDQTMKYLLLTFLFTLTTFAVSSDKYLEINKKASKLFVAQNNFSFESADKEIVQALSKARWDLLKLAKDSNDEAKKLFLDFIKKNKASKAEPENKKLKYQVILSRNNIDALLSTEPTIRTQFSEAYASYATAMKDFENLRSKLFNNETEKTTYQSLVLELQNMRNQAKPTDF